MEDANRILQHDILPAEVSVSTVFLGIDHGFRCDRGLPVLWETMIFGGPHDGYQNRYTSRTDALSPATKLRLSWCREPFNDRHSTQYSP
jgi:hypothetical protein